MTCSSLAASFSIHSPAQLRLIAIAAAAGLVVALLLVAWLAARPHRERGGFLRRVVDGLDDRGSTSKLNALLWTVVGCFTVALVVIERVLTGHVGALPGLPAQLVAAMTMAGATAVGARCITTAYTARGLVDKTASPGEPLQGGLVTADDGHPDLAKLQLVLVTGVAVALYLVRVVAQPLSAGGAALEIPDLDGVLVAMMGVSQSAYLGAKLATVKRPRLIGSDTTEVTPGGVVQIYGFDLGRAGQVHFDDTPVPTTAWSERSIACAVPAQRQAGQPWRAGDRVKVTVRASGRRAANEVGLLIT